MSAFTRRIIRVSSSGEYDEVRRRLIAEGLRAETLWPWSDWGDLPNRNPESTVVIAYADGLFGVYSTACIPTSSQIIPFEEFVGEKK